MSDQQLSSNHFDVAIVGSGIVGLANAWAAARQGLSVIVLERERAACGASVRNFGMVWPIGQSAGIGREAALLSREFWLEFARSSGAYASECGSIHLAHRTDEWAVLEEFQSLSDSLGYECELLSPAAVLQKCPAAQERDLFGGLWSPSEVAVNPRQAIAMLPGWLQQRYGVRFEHSTLVSSVSDNRVEAADGRVWRADRTIVCSGADFQTLFPEVYAGSGIKRCKLQMLRTTPQPSGWSIGTHIASGLTLRHYANFAPCSSLAALKRRVAEETPELDRYGIHVMVSQNETGHAILGDSHEYDDFGPFDSEEINELMLRELRKVVHLQDWTIDQRWHGVYAKHPSKIYFEAEPLPGVKVVNALGGAGMTLSFGLAEILWKSWGWSSSLIPASQAATLHPAST